MKNNAYKTSTDYSKLRELLQSGKNIVVFTKLFGGVAFMYARKNDRDEIYGEFEYRFKVDDTISYSHSSFHDFNWEGKPFFEYWCNKIGLEFIEP